MQISRCSTSKVPPSVFTEMERSSWSPEDIAASLNEMELTNSRSLGTLHANAKRAYPWWKTCTVCSTVYPCLSKEQAVRNVTCSRECAVDLTRAPRPETRGRKPGCWLTMTCTECGKSFERRRAWARSTTLDPKCSRRCNGKARGRDLDAHPNRGAGRLTPEAIAKRAAKMRGPANPAWRGGVTTISRKGNYIKHEHLTRCPPDVAVMARSNGYVLVHRLVVARAIGRPLTAREAVHHINHDPTDNRPENLMLFASNRDHKLYEAHGSPAPLWCGSTP